MKKKRVRKIHLACALCLQRKRVKAATSRMQRRGKKKGCSNVWLEVGARVGPMVGGSGIAVLS